MTGTLHPAGSAPLITPVQAQVLLDQVIYEQVLEHVDVDALVELQQSLTAMVEELDGIGPDRAYELAQAMLDRAVLRLPDDIRRYVRVAVALSTDCELYDDEAREVGRTSAQPPRASRSRT